MLVVEDEMMVSMMIEEMLDELGCATVGPVSRVGDALALARDAGIDLAVLDVNLHGEQSYPVADLLAARGVPYVFATGYGRAGLRDGYRHVPVISKPFQTRDLERALVAALRRA